jgi:predicted Zn-dependent peptidase
MNFEKIQSESLHEEIFHLKHPCGPDIYVSPKRGYSSQYAIFGTRYGSIDNMFIEGGQTVRVPEGIAHFLEHKLFESEDGDAFTRFAKTGASANAYTSFDRTCYLFSSTANFEQSLRILLDFVQHPYFTDKTVGKEQGIIGQEIRMYDDDPNWQVLFGLLGCLYAEHPVRIDIAGTTGSIAKITPELLYKCYNSYYNLNNMVLSVAGDVDPELVGMVADECFKSAPPMSVKSVFPDEPSGIVSRRAEKKLSVASPLFALGFKAPASDGIRAAMDEVVCDIVFEMLCGDASSLYRELYDKGLINGEFGTQYFSGRSFAAAIASGESHDPDAVARALIGGAVSMKENGFRAQDFETAKRAVFGAFASHYDSVDAIANDVAGCRFMDMGPFAMADAAAAVTADDVMNALAQFSPDKCAVSVVSPLE